MTSRYNIKPLLAYFIFIIINFFQLLILNLSFKFKIFNLAVSSMITVPLVCFSLSQLHRKCSLIQYKLQYLLVLALMTQAEVFMPDFIKQEVQYISYKHTNIKNIDSRRLLLVIDSRILSSPTYIYVSSSSSQNPSSLFSSNYQKCILKLSQYMSFIAEDF